MDYDDTDSDSEIQVLREIVPGNVDNEAEDEDMESDENEMDENKAAPAALSVTSAAGNPQPIVDDDDEDGYLCLICCCPFTNSGEHRLSCLACGHIFGKSCILKWLKNASTCPQCNDRARKKDVRVLYTKQLQALDTAERDRALQNLEEAKMDLQKTLLEMAKLKLVNQQNVEEITKLKAEIRNYQEVIKRLEALSIGKTDFNVQSELDRMRAQPSSSTSSAGRSDNSAFYTRVNQYPYRGDECRVGVFGEWSNAFVVSHKFTQHPGSSLVRSFGSFGIRVFNWGDPKKSCNMPIHQKEIRDMAFSPCQTDLLLTVGMDCKAYLTNVHSQLQALSINVEHPIWSCAFNQDNANLIYFGLNNGEVLTYDMRNPKESVRAFTFGNDKTPVGRLHYVPPSYQQGGYSVCGLLTQKIRTCWFSELSSDAEPGMHQLPFDGCYLGVDFEPVSRHALVSTRPSNSSPSKHHVCELTRGNHENGSAFACNLVKSYAGGALTSKLYRPKIFSPAENRVLIASSKGSNEVEMWDLSDDSLKQHFYVPGFVLDYIPVKYNDSSFMTFLTSDSLEVYRLTL